MYEGAVEAGLVFPSGEGEIKGRERHFLSPLGGREIGEELRWVREKGDWGMMCIACQS